MSDQENVPLAEMFAGLLAFITMLYGVHTGSVVHDLGGLYLIGVLACVRSYTRVIANG